MDHYEVCLMKLRRACVKERRTRTFKTHMSLQAFGSMQDEIREAAAHHRKTISLFYPTISLFYPTISLFSFLPRTTVTPPRFPYSRFFFSVFSERSDENILLNACGYRDELREAAAHHCNNPNDLNTPNNRNNPNASSNNPLIALE